MSIKQWAAARLTGKVAKPNNPHIVIEHRADGTKHVTDHPTKKAAMDHGKALRNSGKPVNVHDEETSKQFGLDPRYKGPTGDAYLAHKRNSN
jgi:hypothetical protein